MICAEIVINLNVELFSVVVGGRSERIPVGFRSSQPTYGCRIQAVGRPVSSKPIRVRHVSKRSRPDNTRRIKNRTVGIPRGRTTCGKDGGAAWTIVGGKRNHGPVRVEPLSTKNAHTLQPRAVIWNTEWKTGSTGWRTGGVKTGCDGITRKIDRARDPGRRSCRSDGFRSISIPGIPPVIESENPEPSRIRKDDSIHGLTFSADSLVPQSKEKCLVPDDRSAIAYCVFVIIRPVWLDCLTRGGVHLPVIRPGVWI